MATDRFSALHELLPELTTGHESAAYEAEAEQLFGRLADLAGPPPGLRRLAQAAGRSALGGLAALAADVEDGLSPAPDREVSPLARIHPDLAGRGGLDPLRRAFGGREALATMEHLGHAAAGAATEAEAEALLGALAPIAATLAPRVAPLVLRSTPGLIRGVSGVARTLWRRPALRPLIRTLPAIVRATVAQLDRHPRPTSQAAVRTLASQAARVLGSPALCAQIWDRSRALDNLYHGSAARCRSCGRAATRRCPCGCGATRPAGCSCARRPRP